MNFTPDQQKVIDIRGQNILVSAAAGSGKTAVLVERIVRMISEGDPPADVDHLLVVTFTNMAASEMRERIGLAIGARLEQEPDNEHLQRQVILLHNAQITTIDSFCLFILRNHFHTIGLDPGFRVADEGELKLLSRDVMEELLEDWYAEGGETFLAFMEYMATGSRDQIIEEHIAGLYTFSMSFPWPEEWLMERKRDYAVLTAAEVEESNWGQFLFRYIRKTTMGCVEEIIRCIGICEQADGPYMYSETLEQEAQMLGRLSQAGNLSAFGELWSGIRFGRLPSKKDDTVTGEKRAEVQAARNRVKDIIKEIGEDFLGIQPEQETERMAVIREAADVLIELTLDYKKRLDAAKREKNIIDFGDMEHFALSILLEKQGEEYVPTAAAREWQAYFVEILTDEYQDSNLVQEYLLRSISKESEGCFNRFMVGDVKQSIYRFRLARPELFLEKYDSYPLDEEELSEKDLKGKSRRIDLRQNFRSRTEVLDSVNYIFERIMQKSLGGVEYDRQAALYPGAVYPVSEEGTGDYQTELLLLELKEEGADRFSGDSPKEMEARMIAGRIREMAGVLQVTDRESGRLRPACYRDMVILLRAGKDWGEVFKKILEEEGIPSYMAATTGYFEAREIQTILQVVRVLDNPLQDIPLVGVLKSFFGGFDDGELAVIQATYKEKIPFYQKVMMTGQDGDTKATSFLRFIETFRQKAVYVPIRDLLKELILDSGYYHYCAAQPAGEQRCGNLEMLLTRAASFAETSYYGLFHFIRYIEQLEKYDVDYGEASIMDEQADVVRLMSIHKSKGLEFPVCIVAGLGKKFNMRDSYGSLVLDADIGMGMDYVNTGLRVRGRSLRKGAVSLKRRLDDLGEELRVLYVAMTRAREKLILSGAVKTGKSVSLTSGRLSFLQLSAAGNSLDFLLPILPGMEAGSAIKTSFYTSEALFAAEVTGQIEQSARRRELITQAFGGARPQSILGLNALTRMSQKFSRRYPYEKLEGLYTKTTVSELKKGGGKSLSSQEEMTGEVFTRMLYQEPEIVPYIPLFMKGQEDMTGTIRGSAYHKVMELIIFQGLEELLGNRILLEQELNRQMDRAYEDGRLAGEYRDAVRIAKVSDFFMTALAHRMIQADRSGKLYKEQPFVIGLDADQLSHDFPAEETILIQGIIDVFFEVEGELVVMDYKTDAVDTVDELVTRYGRQLDYYEEALEQLTGKRVREKIIYSFALGQEIPL